MEFARLGNHLVSVCPYCDILIECPVSDTTEADAADALGLLYQKHLRTALDCKIQAEAAPTLTELLAAMHPGFAEAEMKRQKRIDSHPDNGRVGFWLVVGVRHEARTQASSAREAIEKCSEVVRSWESPEARFLGEELPEVF